MTTCQPVQTNSLAPPTSSVKEAPVSEFKGAVCVNLNPVGPISEYFYFQSEMSSYFLTDSVPESITLESGI
jgi:hypothetical protein